MKIIALILISVAALALGFVEAFGTGLPEDRVFSPDERHAIAKMRLATKADPNFVGDPGYLLSDSSHSSAAGPDGAPCFDERYLYFWYRLGPPLDLLGGTFSIPMRHRIVNATAPATCYDSFGNATAREDLWEATSYLDVGRCFTVTGNTVHPTPGDCTFHAWVPVAEEPPVPAPLPPGCFPWPFFPGYVCLMTVGPTLLAEP